MRQTRAYLEGVIADLRFKLWCVNGGDPPIGRGKHLKVAELVAEIARLRALVAALNNTVNPRH